MASQEKFPPTEPSPEENPELTVQKEGEDKLPIPGDRELNPEERAALAEALRRAKGEDGNFD